MVVTRRNVYSLGDDWADDVLWYARGVRAMQQRPLSDPTSWRFFAAIHGFDAQRWAELGALTSADQPPAADLIRRYWLQCQHGSWYFLPWHRAYVLAFEAVVRDAIVKADGPATWALPYWNYFRPGEEGLPPAFAFRSWPDGANDNPLFVGARFGPLGDGNVFIPVGGLNLDAMADPEFSGSGSGGATGFGGIDTGFSHSGQIHGGIELQPHDNVHGYVGGRRRTEPRIRGAMADPRSAALDPIFWLHHANIDRLWASWNTGPPPFPNPTAPTWLSGPTAAGDRTFSLPKPNGQPGDFRPSTVLDIGALGYEYDDLTPGAPPVPSPMRRVRPVAPSMVPAGGAEGGDVAAPREVELIGANDVSVPLRAGPIRTDVRMDPAARRKVVDSVNRAIAPDAREAFVDGEQPDRVFLNLENVRGDADAASFQVYVGVPDGAAPAEHPDRLAGTVGLFGISQASDPAQEHAGQGITYVLEISGIVDRMQVAEGFDVDSLPVTIVMDDEDDDLDVTIGRVSIFRQGR